MAKEKAEKGLVGEDLLFPSEGRASKGIDQSVCGGLSSARRLLVVCLSSSILANRKIVFRLFGGLGSGTVT